MLKFGIEVDYKCQVELAASLGCLHNFVMIHDKTALADLDLFDVYDLDLEGGLGDRSPGDGRTILDISSRGLSEAKVWRDQMAQRMWNERYNYN